MITNKESNFISAVCYVHNRETVIVDFLNSLYECLNNRFKQFEIICVNDASTDKSKAEIESFVSNKKVIVSIVNMGTFQGIEQAMAAGVDLAIGDFVYEFDSVILDYDMMLITDLYYKALEGNDIVAAVPLKVRGTWSKLFYAIFNRYRTCENELRQETFHIVSRRAINKANDISKLLVYRKAAYANSGLKLSFISYENKGLDPNYDRKALAARQSLATDTIILFTNAVPKITALLSAFFLGATILIGSYTWLVYFSAKKPVEGWTPLMLYLSMGFFGIFLILSIIVKYLSIILNLIYKRKHYLVESIEKITIN
jgi:dolichol-phosphate mannosyltransferase